MKKIVILVGPKGAGKSYIANILQKHLNFKFVRVEDIWLKIKSCKSYKTEDEYFNDLPNFLNEGLSAITKVIQESLEKNNEVVIESLGLPPLFDQQIKELKKFAQIVIVKIEANLDLCLQRINSRDHSIHIPVSDKKIMELNQAVEKNNSLPFDFSIRNENLNEKEIVGHFTKELTLL